MRIGLDFDNTLAGYDHVFAPAAQALGLDVPVGAGKRVVRDQLRRREDGETQWMRLQGQVYGRFMHMARLLDGAGTFLRQARAQGAEIWIVSHKTQYGHYDDARIDLRQAARAWMTEQGFFAADGFGLDPARVLFAPTRREKVDHIAALGLDVFVDDLEEVFAEPHFPQATRRLLYHPGDGAAPSGPFTVFSHWDEITPHVFAAS